MLLVAGSSEMSLFRHLSNHVFRSLLVQKYISCDGRPFFENIQSYIEVGKMQKIIRKIFFVSEIIPSEDVGKICVYYEENTCNR